MDKEEFKEIFDTYFDTIRSYIFYRCGNEEKASDLAQDLFLVVWDKRKQLESNHIKALLYKMANDMVITDYRKNVSHQNFVQYMTYEGEKSLTPQEYVQFEELKHSYAKALDDMGDAQREAFLMSRNEGLKYSEISERLGISVKAVEKRMSIALSFLREKLL